ncbi:hypothetical protein BGZ63DRAFT_359578 [Mariannaea sp. PMI_226]|nr:hypothetical protein BGZ63DRAFT_359578 [Mariannaea sp. PMI_226]
MRSWQLAGPGPVERTLTLTSEAPRPAKTSTSLQQGQVLVAISRAALNPADHKIPELGAAAKAATQFPKTPGMDFSGRVVVAASDVVDAAPGDFVLGRIPVTRKEGSLSEYAVVNRDSYVIIPLSANKDHGSGPAVDLDQAAGAPTAALSAYLTIAPHAKVGDRVFINGGSGGVGLFGIQIAKLLGCHVTVTCSTAKAQLCRDMGADDIIDYKTSDVLAELQRKGQVHSLIVDNVCNSPPNLYAASHNFLLPKGKYVYVGGNLSSSSVMSLARSLLLPGFLGGGKRKFVILNLSPDRQALEQIVRWMVEGKVKTVIDSVFEFDQAEKAFEKLKQGSSAGKIIVRVDAQI